MFLVFFNKKYTLNMVGWRDTGTTKGWPASSATKIGIKPSTTAGVPIFLGQFCRTCVNVRATLSGYVSERLLIAFHISFSHWLRTSPTALKGTLTVECLEIPSRTAYQFHNRNKHYFYVRGGIDQAGYLIVSAVTVAHEHLRGRRNVSLVRPRQQTQ